MRTVFALLVIAMGVMAGMVRAAAPAAGAGAATAPAGGAAGIPTLFIAGDSTAASNTQTAMGWGRVWTKYFDPAKIKLNNLGQSGLSSRTYYNTRWAGLINQVKPNDFVIIQFGHNDNGPIDTGRMRGTAPSLGEETVDFQPANGPKEVVHTFGWYMRTMVHEVQAKGAVPIIVSMTVRGEWTDGKVERGFGPYAKLAGEVAKAEPAGPLAVRYIDLTNIVADEYERMGQDAVKKFFVQDTTHTIPAGADLNARMVIAGIKALHENAIVRTLSAEGRAIEPAKYEQVMVPKLPVPRGNPVAFERWLNLPAVADPSLPSIILIGDSTVRNGRGDALDTQWGWGDPLAAWFDLSKVNVVNRAVGGTTAGSFYNGRWSAVKELVKAGDLVLMQFGTNQEGQQPYMDNLRKYVADIKAKGATPVICTLIPRNSWANGKMARTDPHVGWAKTVADEQKVALIDLNNLIADQYDAIGREATTALFASGPHTNKKGAELNARVVAEALKKLPGEPVGKFAREKPAATW